MFFKFKEIVLSSNKIGWKKTFLQPVWKTGSKKEEHLRKRKFLGKIFEASYFEQYDQK